LDVYVFTRERTQQSVDAFLNAYVDRLASERMADDISMLPLDALTDPPPHDWEVEPASTLSEVVAHGLRRPFRAFVRYLKPLPSVPVALLALGFTSDGQVVLGGCIEYTSIGGDPELEHAKAFLEELARRWQAHSGFIGEELPPPLLVGEVPKPSAGDRVVYRWNRGAV
jgi:hypothetical protein